MDVVLWQIEVSHYNEKVRWALDYKVIPHERRAPLPGFHRARALMLTRGAHSRLPVVRLDGRTIGDSSAIVAALEEHAPEPPLYPADPAERAAALELERHFDGELAPRVRRFLWLHTIDDSDAIVGSLAQGYGPLRARVAKTLVPLFRPLVKRDFDLSADREADAREGIDAAMDRLEREVGPSGYLVGGAFSVADLTAAALFTPLLCPPGRQYPPPQIAPAVRELREELEARAGGAWVEEMYRRHRGASAELVA